VRAHPLDEGSERAFLSPLSPSGKAPNENHQSFSFVPSVDGTACDVVVVVCVSPLGTLALVDVVEAAGGLLNFDRPLPFFVAHFSFQKGRNSPAFESENGHIRMWHVSSQLWTCNPPHVFDLLGHSLGFSADIGPLLSLPKRTHPSARRSPARLRPRTRFI